MANEKAVLQILLPLTPPVYHSLLALSEGSRHGYAIAQQVESQTEGRLRMGPGTLYGTLQRMSRDGLIVESSRPTDDAPHRQRRRYYRMTPLGRRVLKAEAQRLLQAVSLAKALLIIEEPEAS